MNDKTKHASEYDALEASSTSMRFALRRERLLLKVTQALCEALADAGVNQATLARKLAKSESFVSQILAGGRNLTLRTVADVATALDREVSVSLKERNPCKPMLRFPVAWQPKQDFAVTEPAAMEMEEGAA
jgi:transcriptional regulator with XRE-family HTH domain